MKVGQVSDFGNGGFLGHISCYNSKEKPFPVDVYTLQKRIAEIKHKEFALWCENLSPDKRTEHCIGVPKFKI
jgi:hypothetical protein